MKNCSQLTPHQRLAMDAIQCFLASSDDCFILKGSAGTGKTTLIAELSSVLSERGRPIRLLAPTGRAARVLGSKAHSDAHTIHRVIYSLSEIDVFESAESANDPGMRLTFPLRTDDPENTLFIVDESSMVGDAESKGDLLQFGSGRLLADLIQYARLGRPGRPGQGGAKVLFVGDPAQLPPVGESFSPALSANHLRKTFGIECTEHELTEVLRQQSGSPILQAATNLRETIRAKTFNSLNIAADGAGIIARTTTEAVGLVEKAVREGASSVLITYSNSQALNLNRAVRGRLWGDESAGMQIADILLVNRNSQKTGLQNGDLIEVLGVEPKPECRFVSIRGIGSPVELSFRAVVVSHAGPDGRVVRQHCKILENLLGSSARDLSPLEQRALLVDFRQRHPTLRPKTAEFRLAIQQDEYFNALQVKYGYAVTCHKAQGGEWDTAIVDFGDGRGQRNEAFFRWTYTAVTRAKKRLVTINAPHFDALSSMAWGTDSHTLADPGTVPLAALTDADWSRLAFQPGQERLFEHHLALRDAWDAHGIRVENVDHLQFRERYCLSRGAASAAVDYIYNGKCKVATVAAAPGRTSDPQLLPDALAAMQDALLPGNEPQQELTDPFLSAFKARVLKALAGSNIRVTSTEPRQYVLRMGFECEAKRANVDFFYDNTPKWTRVLTVGRVGEGDAVLERLQALMRVDQTERVSGGLQER